MMGRTHAMGGLASLWLIQVAAPVLLTADPLRFAPLAIAAVCGSLLPDLDATESLLKNVKVGGVKPFLLPAFLLNRSLGHRGVLHSALGLLAALCIALIFVDPILAAAFSLGYGSHLLLDSLTRSGIPLWYPLKGKYSPLPLKWRIVTGSAEEELVFIVLALSAFVLVLSKLTSLAP